MMRRRQVVPAKPPSKPGEALAPADPRREELRLLDEAIAATEEAARSVDDGFAWELSLRGLRARREALLREVATQEARSTVPLSPDASPS